MSKRVLIISAVFLVVGSGLIPGGILIENSIHESVVNSVGEGLLGIEEEAIPLIESIIQAVERFSMKRTSERQNRLKK